LSAGFTFWLRQALLPPRDADSSALAAGWQRDAREVTRLAHVHNSTVAPVLRAQLRLATRPTFYSWSGCPTSKHEVLFETLRSLGWTQEKKRRSAPNGSGMYFQCASCCYSGKCCVIHRSFPGLRSATHKSAPSPALLNRLASPSRVHPHCMSGCKDNQLRCRRAFAAWHGCDYDALGVQPASYIVAEHADCAAFARAASAGSKAWLAKAACSSHGEGIRYFPTSPRALEFARASCARFASWRARRPWHGVMTEYVKEPATVGGGFRFDRRSYLLVASVSPLLAFHHEGCAPLLPVQRSRT